jgi:hypothetical protein
MTDFSVLKDASSDVVLIKDDIQYVVELQGGSGAASTAAAILAEELAEDAQAAAEAARDAAADAATAAAGSASLALAHVDEAASQAAAAATSAGVALVAEGGAQTADNAAQTALASILAALAGTSLTTLTLPAADRTVLAGLDTSLGFPANLMEEGREGLFIVKDYAPISAAVDADTRQGVYVRSTFNTAKVWVRANSDIAVNAFWFMSAAEVADVRAFTALVNVTDALNAAASFIAQRGGGTVLCPPGKYRIGKQTFQGTLLDGTTPCAYGAHEVLTVKNATRLVRMSGYGAILQTEAGLKWGAFDHATGNRYDPASLPYLDYNNYGYIFRSMINLEANSGGVVVEGFELDGNNTQLVLGGRFGDSDRQLEGSGLWIKNNAFVELKDLYIHHQTTDGIIVATASSQPDSAVRQPVTIDNVRCIYNGRNGMSPVGVNQMHVRNSVFNNSGQALNTVSSELVRSSPGAGIDIEADASINRGIILDAITCVGNYQNGIAMASGDSRGTVIRRSKIEGFTIGRSNVTFEDCTVIGYCTASLADTDPYKPTASGLSLTIAGTGPYTITRSAGDFTADGFVAGSTIWLSGSGLNAANKSKRLYVTALTATVATVTVIDGSAMVAEGPIASSTVATAYTLSDGQRFIRTKFTYDPKLTESGTLINSTQSVFNQMPFGLFDNCEFDCMSTPLPNMNNRSALGTRTDSYPLIKDTRMRSASSTVVNLDARWQGYNYVTTPAVVGFSGNGRIEDGDILYNGASTIVQKITTAGTVTPTSLNKAVHVTAQASALLFANPTGIPVSGQIIEHRIRDNGTARAITYGTQYRGVGQALPSTTVANKLLYMKAEYNGTDTKWDVVDVAQE